jgi:hypothetical protein
MKVLNVFSVISICFSVISCVFRFPLNVCLSGQIKNKLVFMNTINLRREKTPVSVISHTS